MTTKRNAPARVRSEGVECRFAGDFDAYTTIATRCKYLARFGVPLNRAGLISSLAFGEAAR